MKIMGIVLAGGSGKRFNAKLPKQYISLNGKLVIQYSLEAFKKSNLFSQIIVVADKKYHNLFKNFKCVDAGETRTLSVYNGLCACPKDTDYVIFHDACRPFIKTDDLKQYVVELKNYDGVITAEEITDSLYFAPRENYKLIQTPEAFNFKTLINSFDKDHNTIAIYEQIQPANLKFIYLNHSNLKITYDRDIFTAERLIKYSFPVKTNTRSLKNKKVLIFGGTGGIGQAVIKLLKKHKAKVVSLGSKDLDLSKPIIDFPFKEKYDCIIYSAGVAIKDDKGLINNYDKIMNVNFRGFVSVIDNIDKLLKAKGSIIAIGSTSSTKGRAGISLYSASKSALNTFVESISSFLEPKGIKINVISPAKVNTGLQDNINPMADKAKMIQPKDLAKIIINYVVPNETGQIIYLRVGQV